MARGIRRKANHAMNGEREDTSQRTASASEGLHTAGILYPLAAVLIALLLLITVV